MTDITINLTAPWRPYWGRNPLPQGARALGAVTRDTGDTGALIAMPTGVLCQGNAGALRSLPREAGVALVRAQVAHLLATMTREQLAVALGVTVSAIDHWTSGRRNPSRTVQMLIERLAAETQ